MVFTLFCCGTCSNSFDAYGAWERPEDEWDRSPEIYNRIRAATFRPSLLPNRPDEFVSAEAREIWEAIFEKPRRQRTVRDHRFPEGEIVSTLATRHRGREYVDWAQIDGPGSGNHQDSMLWTQPGGYSAERGIGTGAGMDENVKHAIALLRGRPDASAHGANSLSPQALQQQIVRMGRSTRGPMTRVNLVGWSRGAVTCIMIANAIQDAPDLRHLEVNIFAVDPVPGGLNQSIYSTMTRLPACVRNYFGVYVADERSRGFTPVVPPQPTSCHVVLLPLPGMHATVAGSPWLDKNATVGSPFVLSGPGTITRFWAEQFLLHWGTDLERHEFQNNHTLYALYERILINLPEFMKMREYSYTQLSQGDERDIYEEGTGYSTNSWSFSEYGGHRPQMQMMLKWDGRWFINWDHLRVYRHIKARTYHPSMGKLKKD
jgi:hypothetical protein